MNEFIAQILSAGAGGGIVGGIVYLMISNYLNGHDKEREKLASDLETLANTIENLKNERVAKLENRIEVHLNSDRNQEIITKLNSIASRQGRIEDIVSNQSTNVATLIARVDASHLYIENLDESFQRHKTEKHS